MSGQAIADVLAERVRQKSVEGWTEEHDDWHIDRSLAKAAACYAAHAGMRNGLDSDYEKSDPPFSPPHWAHWARLWPKSWATYHWKPKSPRRDLVRAAALIIAEIERIDRAALTQRQEDRKP